MISQLPIGVNVVCRPPGKGRHCEDAPLTRQSLGPVDCTVATVTPPSPYLPRDGGDLRVMNPSAQSKRYPTLPQQAPSPRHCEKRGDAAISCSHRLNSYNNDPTSLVIPNLIGNLSNGIKALSRSGGYPRFHSFQCSALECIRSAPADIGNERIWVLQ